MRLRVGLAGLLALVVTTACTATAPSARPPETAPPETALPTKALATTALADLSLGPAPRLTYADGLTVVRPDGARERLAVPRGVRSLSSLRIHRGGYLIGDTRYFEGTNGLFLSRHAQVEELGPGTSGGGATSPDGRRLAWATASIPEAGLDAPTRVHLRTPSGERTQTVAVPPMTNPTLSVVGFAGHRVVYTRLFSDGVWVTDLITPPQRVRALESAVAATERLVAGQVSERVGAVVDLRSGEVRWRARGVTLGAVSPDGSLVLARRATGWVALDAATGAVRHRLALPVGTRAEQVVWEDDAHALAVATRGRRQAVVRLGLDGSAERATDVVRYRAWPRLVLAAAG